jgi:hypothetical protein
VVDLHGVISLGVFSRFESSVMSDRTCHPRESGVGALQLLTFRGIFRIVIEVVVLIQLRWNDSAAKGLTGRISLPAKALLVWSVYSVDLGPSQLADSANRLREWSDQLTSEGFTRVAVTISRYLPTSYFISLIR